MFINQNNMRFKAVLSGGPGGQNANRRATKVQIWVAVEKLPLTPEEKRRVRSRLARFINHKDEIEVVRHAERYQIQNKREAMVHMEELIAGALKVRRPRVPTVPTRAAEERRIEAKKRQGEKKRARRAG